MAPTMNPPSTDHPTASAVDPPVDPDTPPTIAVTIVTTIGAATAMSTSTKATMPRRLRGVRTAGDSAVTVVGIAVMRRAYRRRGARGSGR